MSITVQDKIFYINGKTYTYAFFVNEVGVLQHLYYGTKIAIDDVEFYIKHIATVHEPKLCDPNRDVHYNGMPGEIGFFARGDYREPTVLLERVDGATMSRFSFVAYEIYNGSPNIEGMPHSRCGGQTLCVLLKDDFSDAQIKLNYTAFEDSDVLIRNAEIVNCGATDITCKKAFSFCFDLADSNFDLMQLRGAWAMENSPVLMPVNQGIVKVQSLRETWAHDVNPFIALLRKNCNEICGECYGVQLIYSGAFTVTVESVFDGLLRIQGGICDTNFSWLIKSGECFTTPQVALCYSNDGIGGMSRSYHDFIKSRIISHDYACRPRPVLFNNWEATYFDFNENKLFSLIDEAAQLGIDTFVLDDGWFGNRNNDKAGLGDWVENRQKIKCGLSGISKYCKNKGLKFGIWIEPESINEDSDLYRMHPNWVVCKTGVEPCRSRNQLLLDFTQPKVVDYIFSAISKILSENDIEYVKWDVNRSITECFSQKLENKRQGEFLHRYVLGVYDLADKLTKKFPNILFEGCSGGGGRFDTGMLYYFPQIWTSDDTDAYERTKIQWGTSMCYPISAMSCHVSICPNHQTGRTIPMDTRGNVASLGSFGYELDLTKLTEEEKDCVKLQIQNYKQIEDLVLNGDLYRLSNPFDTYCFCEMLVSKDKSKAYAVGVRTRGMPWDIDNLIKLVGLDEGKTYYIKELEITASGKALSTIGLLMPKLGDYQSWVWHIEEKN